VSELLCGGDVLFRVPILASFDGGRDAVGAEVDEHVPTLTGL
jgi:hypothetical protein